MPEESVHSMLRFPLDKELSHLIRNLPWSQASAIALIVQSWENNNLNQLNCAIETLEAVKKVWVDKTVEEHGFKSSTDSSPPAYEKAKKEAKKKEDDIIYHNQDLLKPDKEEPLWAFKKIPSSPRSQSSESSEESDDDEYQSSDDEYPVELPRVNQKKENDEDKEWQQFPFKAGACIDVSKGVGQVPIAGVNNDSATPKGWDLDVLIEKS